MKEKIKIFIVLSLISILIIFYIKIFFFKKSLNIQEINNYIFFKIISNEITQTKNKNEENKYEFKVNYKNTNFKSINLLTTADNEKIVYEKIAPGTRGSFNIILNSDKKFKYKIIFESISEKPQNLNFIALENEQVLGCANTLEELSQYLEGNISKEKRINIKINWYWNYEDEKNSKLSDIQDTKDSKIIKKYQFNIYTLGEQID